MPLSTNTIIKVPAQAPHRMIRWIVDDRSPLKIGAKCACGVEVWDGSRYVPGNHEEVMSKMRLHIRGLL